ncbi:hypothetical protein H4582DRAFT_2059565 [Lactarius indigo]|nr:hypothetical protein H4582DRAFT_2059565 [Lactarius indigo]
MPPERKVPIVLWRAKTSGRSKCTHRVSAGPPAARCVGPGEAGSARPRDATGGGVVPSPLALFAPPRRTEAACPHAHPSHVNGALRRRGRGRCTLVYPFCANEAPWPGRRGEWHGVPSCALLLCERGSVVMGGGKLWGKGEALWQREEVAATYLCAHPFPREWGGADRGNRERGDVEGGEGEGGGIPSCPLAPPFSAQRGGNQRGGWGKGRQATHLRVPSFCTRTGFARDAGEGEGRATWRGGEEGGGRDTLRAHLLCPLVFARHSTT